MVRGLQLLLLSKSAPSRKLVAAAMANGTAWENTATRHARRVRMPQAPKIFFASRTHSQLAQCVKELKRCKGFQNWTLEAELAPSASAWRHRHDLQAAAAKAPAAEAAVTATSSASLAVDPPSTAGSAAPSTAAGSAASLAAFAYPGTANTRGEQDPKLQATPQPILPDAKPSLPAATPSTGAAISAAPGETSAPLPPLPAARRYSTQGTLRMTVLGSREQYCVHKTVSKSSSKNDDCTAQVRAGSCPHYPIANNLKGDLPVVWDIEEAVARSKAKKLRGGCPYYASKSALEFADIVLCPYSYLVDPAVRNSMSLDVKGAVVILDEAHNIEDVARESASLSLSYLDLEDTLHALQVIGSKDGYSAVAPAVMQPLDAMSAWMRKQCAEMGLGDTAPVSARDMAAASSRGQVVRSARVVPSQKGGRGPKLPERVLSNPMSLTVAERDWSMSAAVLDSWCDSADALLSKLREDTATEGGGAQGSSDAPGATAGSSKAPSVDADLMALQGKVRSALEMLNHTMAFWLRAQEGRYRGDFRVAVTAEQAVDAHGAVCVQGVLHIWCLRASCTMADLAQDAHSIVLTSGTLSPLASFASELGVPFPVRLEAAHVIQIGQQLFSAVLPHAVQRCKPRGSAGGGAEEWATGTGLKAVYATTQTSGYKDGLGISLCSIAESIPGGMLVFFPSYSLLDACVARWQETDCLQQLQALKPVHSEPRGREGKEEFEGMLSSYRTAVVKWTPHRFTAAYSKGLPQGSSDNDVNAVLMARGEPKDDTPKKARGGRHQQQASLKRGWAGARGGRGGRGGGRFGFARKGVQPADGSSRSNGACMLAVCRGKVSEGIDFSDEFARCVVLVGLPYPAFKDPQVTAKRHYQSALAQSERRHALAGTAGTAPAGTVLSGEDWYAQQAFRALNQALGRCIRHRNDYGAVILADPRYNERRTLDGVSRWLRAGVQTGLKGGDFMQNLGRFVAEVPDRVAARITTQEAALAAAAAAAAAPAKPAGSGPKAPSLITQSGSLSFSKALEPPSAAVVCTAATDVTDVQRSRHTSAQLSAAADVSLNSSTSSGNKQYLAASQLPFTLSNVQAAAVARGFGGVRSGAKSRTQLPLAITAFQPPAPGADAVGTQATQLAEPAASLDDSVHFSNLGLDLSQDSVGGALHGQGADESSGSRLPEHSGAATPPTQLATSHHSVGRVRACGAAFAEPLQTAPAQACSGGGTPVSLQAKVPVASQSVYNMPTQAAAVDLSAALDHSQASSLSSGDEAAFQAVARIEREHELKRQAGARGTKRPAAARSEDALRPPQRRRELLGAMWDEDARR